MKRFLKHIIPMAAAVLALSTTSCVKDLDVTPIDPNLITDPAPTEALNKCFASIAMAGNGGANGDSDVDGLDGGTTGFIRQMFNANELPTDEAICAWGDEGIAAFNTNNYDASNPMLRGYYYRLYFGVTICNNYITEFGGYNENMTAQARFLRAFQYYLLMDAFGNIPFTTEVSTKKPVRYTRKQVYDFVEKELLDIEPKLDAPRPKSSADKSYGSVDQAAVWMMLARLYLNAEVYTGKAEWEKARLYAKKVIDSPYKLYTTRKGQWSAYQQLFMGDNGENGAWVEAIFPIIQNGLKTTSWGSTLFIMASSNDKSVHIKNAETPGNNTSESWGGNRCRPSLVAKFFPSGNAPHAPAYDMPKLAGDDRALLDGKDRLLDVVDIGTFSNGFAVCKFNNFRTEGVASSSQFPDTDFFMLRSAEAYLTLAEADARLHGGETTAEGTEAINALRRRANATTRSASYAMDDILDEWSREFYFEGRRRMDLVRFGKFGGNTNYTWQWKGGTEKGTNFAAYKNIYAIPTTDLTVNYENLIQNPKY